MVPSIVLKSLYFYEFQFQAYSNWHMTTLYSQVDPHLLFEFANCLNHINAFEHVLTCALFNCWRWWATGRGDTSTRLCMSQLQSSRPFQSTLRTRNQETSTWIYLLQMPLNSRAFYSILCVRFKNLRLNMPWKGWREARRWVRIGSLLNYEGVLKT
jgi:hypothetical protein